MVEEDNPTEYDWTDDVQHLLETLQSAGSALDALWRIAEPLLSRGADRNTSQTARWSYYQVFDALKHSSGWLQRMPRRASDGTAVWDEEPADTNEALTHGVEESEARGDLERRRGQERRDQHENDDLASRGIRIGNGSTLSRTETPQEARARKARAEETRLANLRKPPRTRKATKKK